ncbi:TPA: aminoglycoside phosphotransferase family protein [Legionella pneumophila]
MFDKEILVIDSQLVQQLIVEQFPQWARLKITPVKSSGWDNRTFHLGENMLVRLPSRAEYASQVTREQNWLPKLKPFLPVPIPKPLAMGMPSEHYPWHWSIYEWLEGETLAIDRIKDLNQFALDLANFLRALQQCDSLGGPPAGPENFHRGASLTVYDKNTREAIKQVGDIELSQILTKIWNRALASSWQKNPVWIHGDIAVGNLLINNGRLSAVIDFGQFAIGDPACDLALFWTFFTGESQSIFREAINLDEDTWDRARGWVLWKTLCAPIEGTNCKQIIDTIVYEFSSE